MMSEEYLTMKKISDAAPVHRRPKKIVIPRREASVVVPPRKIVFPSPDRTTCAECPCFPKEDPYRKPKRLLPCHQSPRLLYELAAEAVDKLKFPTAFGWSVKDVAKWMSDVVGLPQYQACISDNHIDGMRLLMLEDPSKLPEINIHNFEHIKMITAKVREEYTTGFVKFLRSIGLPPRKPLTHCTWFKSRTGPSWGIRKNWNRSDIIRWMKLIMPEPLHLDHWDLVWYQKPDFPKVSFARVAPPDRERDHIPLYKPSKDICTEYTVPRKFRLLTDIPEDFQFIWMERPYELPWKKPKQKDKKMKKPLTKFVIKAESRLLPKKIATEGLKGKDLILARRLMAKPKFLP